MSARLPLLGAVLAGGAGRRFGGDKARAVVDGDTLVGRAASTLGEVFGAVVVVGPAEADGRWPTIPDLRPAVGPLGGIETALTAAAQRGFAGAFVLACDLPLVSQDTVRSVSRKLVGVPMAAPARPGSPPIEPLCAAYAGDCLSVASELLDRGERAAHALYGVLGGAVVEVPADEFLNVNTLDDAHRAESLLGERRR